MDVKAIFYRVKSFAEKSGQFETVVLAEPKQAPGAGLRAAIWADPDALTPLSKASGLSATTVRLTLNMRVYLSLTIEPVEQIDIKLLTAAGKMMLLLSGDFNLGGLIEYIDLLGIHGVQLRTRMGYLEQDGKQFRVATIIIPMVIEDEYTQAA